MPRRRPKHAHLTPDERVTAHTLLQSHEIEEVAEMMDIAPRSLKKYMTEKHAKHRGATLVPNHDFTRNAHRKSSSVRQRSAAEACHERQKVKENEQQQACTRVPQVWCLIGSPEHQLVAFSPTEQLVNG